MTTRWFTKSCRRMDFSPPFFPWTIPSALNSLGRILQPSQKEWVLSLKGTWKERWPGLSLPLLITPCHWLASTSALVVLHSPSGWICPSSCSSEFAHADGPTETSLIWAHVAFQKTPINGCPLFWSRHTQFLPSNNTNLILQPLASCFPFGLLLTSLFWLLLDCGTSYSSLAPESSRYKLKASSLSLCLLMPFCTFSKAWGVVLALFGM